MGVYLSNMDSLTQRRDGFQVGFLLADGYALMSYSSAQEPLRAANLLKPGAYNIVHLCLDDVDSVIGEAMIANAAVSSEGVVSSEGAVSSGGAVSSSGAVVPATPFARITQRFDLILVVAGGDPFKFNRPDLNNWLRRQAGFGTLIGGVSGGPVILSMAGLMDGYRMTLHWEHAQTLSEISPDSLIERSLYVIDRNRLTCAGGTAPLDMMHALITQHHGADFARRVSDWFLHTTIRESSAPQRSGPAERYRTHDQSILTAIELMENHVAEPLELAQLADIVGLGVRQLNRLFKQNWVSAPLRSTATCDWILRRICYSNHGCR